MKKIFAFLLVACVLLSGCKTGNGNSGKETVGQGTEQIFETETATENMPTEAVEETETEPEPMVTICTDIDSRIIEKDSSFEHMDKLNDYLDAREFSLIERGYRGWSSLFKEDEAEGWTEKDWDLVRPLGQITTSSMGYGKIDYDNDGKKEYIYRSVENGMTAKGYTVSEDGKEITGDYDLMDFYAQFYGEEKLLRQLWFKDMGDIVVSFCLIENSTKNFTIIAFLVGGDSARVLEKRILDISTIEVPERERESYREKDIFASQLQPWDFAAEDSKAFDLTKEELKNLRQDREIEIAEQETGLPEVLVEILQNILTGSERDEEISPEDLMEPYEAKDCKLDEDYVLELLIDSDSYLEGVMDAYRADLDRDGKEEIIMRGYYGGNGLAHPIKIWRQSEDETGKYVEEDIGRDSNATLLFMDGDYYYAARTYSHYLASRVWTVFSFLEDKTVKVDEFTIEPQGTGMSGTKLYENEDLDPQILNSIQSYIEGKKDEIQGDEILWGSSEQPSEYTPDCRAVDVDNNGETESCFKERVYNTSSAGGPTWLHTVISEKYGIASREIEFNLTEEFFSESIDRYVWQLWFDEFDGKNYVFCMERLDGSLDAFLGVFLIQDRKLYPVMNYLLLDKKVVKGETQ